MRPPTAIFGLLAEFGTPQDLLKAVRAARRAGYRVMDAHTPYTVRGLSAALGMPRTQVPFIVLAGGLVGAACGYFMQWWTMARDYPLNVGGRPLNSWPVFIPITFEVMILVASLSALFGMLFLNGLPRLNHPLFNVPRFTEASQTGFFLSIEAIDPRFDAEATRRLLADCNPLGVYDIPHEALEAPRRDARQEVQTPPEGERP